MNDVSYSTKETQNYPPKERYA